MAFIMLHASTQERLKQDPQYENKLKVLLLKVRYRTPSRLLISSLTHVWTPARCRREGGIQAAGRRNRVR